MEKSIYAVNIKGEEVFQALSDITRLRVCRLLATSGEAACLCEIVDSLLEPKYKLSRNIKVLRQAGILSAEKDGRWVYHRLVARPAHLAKLYEAVMALPDPDKVFAGDYARFKKRLSLREAGKCQIGIQTPDLDDSGNPKVKAKPKSSK